ncbi:hypothetical protein [Clostridium chromiireducens]|uniref:hypothetical protein n=1 Tax=Clostridium chromiireducens TaxID=225345 RepID=UPI0011C23974|nr:hypothetical protein [Clostridium chromiireducens]
MEIVNKFFLNYFTLNKDISNGYIELKCVACGEIKDEEGSLELEAEQGQRPASLFIKKTHISTEI